MTFECIPCGFNNKYKSAYDRHISSVYHIKKTTTDVDTVNRDHKFICETCAYSTDDKKLFAVHRTTKRHRSFMAPTKWRCECNEMFVGSQGLTWHKKKCTFIPPNPEQSATQSQQPEQTATQSAPTTTHVDPALLLQMFQTMMQENNKAMQENNNKVMQENNKAIIEAIVSKGNTTNNTLNDNSTTTNNHTQNNTMNLNLFLDEHCKDAMNLTDFFDKLKVFQSDLPDVLRVNNPKAISNILERELGKLSITERPIHCTDVKRKKMFVKNDDKWTSEQGTEKIDQVIRSTCAHQYNAWNKRLQNTDREDRAEKHYDETAEIGAIVGKQTTVWGDAGNRLMQETQNGICNMVYLSKDDARGIVAAANNSPMKLT